MAYKHGKNKRGKRTSEYRSWVHLRQRCTNPNNPYYHRYGGRGIKVCARWDIFKNFLEDMGPKPHPTFSIDRIDNEKGYSPANCRWASRATQALNKKCHALKTKNKYRGVSKLPSGKWAVRIKNKHMGTYKTAAQAALIYNKLAQKIFGQRACLNDLAQK